MIQWPSRIEKLHYGDDCEGLREAIEIAEETVVKASLKGEYNA
jgi:hypothetical protein